MMESVQLQESDMDNQMIRMLVCPLCQGRLIQKDNELICVFDRLAFPIRDGVPVMLDQEARAISLDEKESFQ